MNSNLFAKLWPFVRTAIILVSFIPAKAHADCALQPNGLVAWWRAEGDAKDSEGPNDGALSNGATFAAGLIGQASSFDGVNDGISVPDAAVFRLTTNLTIEGWIKTPGVSAGLQASFIAARSGSDGGSGYEFSTYPLPSGTLRFTFNNGAGGVDLFSSNSVTDNAFHHVAATYDGVKMKVYRDGLLDGERTMNQPITYVAGDPVWIGRRQYAPIPGYYPGLIDELSIYNRALSAVEIAAIHAAGSNGKCGSLKIAALPNAVRLSWPTNATGYLLETNSAVTSPAGWGVLMSNYSVLNGDYFVTNTIDVATRFYRLHKP